ncbi:cytochrome c family protein [Chloroherpeton thalassium ATCC 35110]|uniref:Cytochrome c family protein n=1 Tax=Chloroherpeton thalassium (strain ATCC 35110 / GB-78) TaxID=517418 RepID=B3QW40_CHLT3|nr:tetrathionate reductase family octaheme c-type cytochrome [Chloroherpeton thalassium]ACF14694.1 cytochrome c family protein [Chloroherpeton thalassium ATCC 35110]
MRKILLALPAGALLAILFFASFLTTEHEESDLSLLKEKYSQKYTPPVKHLEFEILQKPFASPQEVTAACISCHNLRHLEVMKSNHWNWEREEYIQGRGVVYIGKHNVLNNFCIGVRGNEPKCAKCHIGYGSTTDGLAIESAKNVDCLVCHDNTETYVKADEQGGAPEKSLNLNLIAQSVGRPTRANCGICHFYGGGGNNVKHGDLESALFEPTKALDVHMGTDGSNLSCVDCHTTKEHNISGKMYSLSSMNHNRVTCDQCHGETPHDKDILNEHTLKVACQTCHIPIYAKEHATKIYWDWSTAGKLKNGEPYEEEDSLGNHTYLSIKGSFVWQKNLQPEYFWFNGTASHYISGDVISDTSKPVVLNELHGSYRDPASKIIPVKRHRALQPYDPVTKLLIQPKLFSTRKGDGAFWQEFDFQKAAAAGMKALNLPFSGTVSFIHTDMYWPINHMVSSKEESVTCKECHTRKNGRLAALTDFYMPGRDYSKVVDFGGSSLLLLTLLGVLAHGSLRIISAFRNRK